MPVKKIAEPPPPYVYQPWPAWVTGKDGRRVVVRNPAEHESITGIRVDENRKPVDVEPERPVPPTLEVVMKAGYSKETAEKIVDEENYKFKAGYPPYGDNVPPELQSHGIGEPVGAVGSDPVQSGQTEDAKQGEGW